MDWESAGGLEHKFLRPERELRIGEGLEISGYASLFGQADQGGDIVMPGAYALSLRAMLAERRKLKMLWQHDPGQPIGIWEEAREDATGLWVSGRLLPDVARGREAAALVSAGAVEGLSIGYRAKKASRDAEGRRLLAEIELWEVSLVTFPMLPTARVQSKERPMLEMLHGLTGAIAQARAQIAKGPYPGMGRKNL